MRAIAHCALCLTPPPTHTHTFFLLERGRPKSRAAKNPSLLLHADCTLRGPQVEVAACINSMLGRLVAWHGTLHVLSATGLGALAG